MRFHVCNITVQGVRMGSACQRSHLLSAAHRRHLEPVGSPWQMMQKLPADSSSQQLPKIQKYENTKIRDPLAVLAANGEISLMQESPEVLFRWQQSQGMQRCRCVCCECCRGQLQGRDRTWDVPAAHGAILHPPWSSEVTDHPREPWPDLELKSELSHSSHSPCPLSGINHCFGVTAVVHWTNQNVLPSCMLGQRDSALREVMS